MADRFLSRWSKRKAAKDNDSLEKKVEAPQSSGDPPVEKVVEEAAPLPTLEDVAKIDRFDPDFSGFMKPDVDPGVQQAALKRMFTDPHFNIMDGLDIYIDDYSKLDPLPPGMLDRMVQSDMLKLFPQAPETTQNTKQAEHQVDDLSIESGKLEVRQETDLTSTQQKASDRLAQVPHEVSKEHEQKKPKKIAHEAKISLPLQLQWHYAFGCKSLGCANSSILM
ncbi:DUF3306 domain-containing protein [Polynucleobacter necessarius]|uniref:DUF3306 domain-containing protein n=1 Tax=Polynucleobacter necessarius TaxID=576610 RepID=UPI001E3E3453|nr:DUF3306 domain-containing protein [Polynucleobacter necessarius]